MTDYRILIKKFGKIKEEDVKRVLEVIHRCYNKSDRKPSVIDLYIFENRRQMISFLNYISNEMGKASFWEIEKYYALHDAWTGIPRIMVSIDILYELPEKVFEGALLHETAHSILHGEISYYIFTYPRILREKFNEETASKIAYLLSIAVKDYEVTDFLLKQNFTDNQIEFIKYLLTPTLEEKEEYMLSKLNIKAKALAIASILKVAMCALPLAKINENIQRKLSNYVKYILPEYHKVVLKILDDFHRKDAGKFNLKGKIETLSEIFVNNIG